MDVVVGIKKEQGRSSKRRVVTKFRRMTGSALQSDGRCGGIKERTREGFQGEGGDEIPPERRVSDFQSSAPA